VFKSVWAILIEYSFGVHPDYSTMSTKSDSQRSSGPAVRGFERGATLDEQSYRCQVRHVATCRAASRADPGG
jgi:hypothetical protein